MGWFGLHAPPPLCQPRLCNGRQSFDSIHSTRLQVARDGHGRTAPARVVLSGRGVVTEWRVHACGESRGVPDCRSVQHDALKPERLGLLCGAPKSYLPRGQIGRFPCPNMIPRRTASSDYAISHLRFSFESFKPSGACAHTKRQAAHTAPHTRLQYVCGTRTSLRVNKGLDSCTRNVQLDDTISSCRAARRRPPG
jgi:hypothetical protein